MALQFTKIVKEEEKGKVNNQPSAPSPTGAEAPKRDGVPALGVKPETTKPGERERKPLGIPLNVTPAMAVGREEETDKQDNAKPETVTPSSPPATKRGPGRPPGTGNGSSKGKPKSATATNKIEALARQIEGVHAMADVIIPGMRIDHSQALLMGEAMQGVIDAYGVVINEKITSVLTLIAVVGIVEAPKLPVLVRFLDSKKKPKQAIQQARAINQQSIPVESVSIPAPSPIASDNPSGLFSHTTNTIAEGNPNE